MKRTITIILISLAGMGISPGQQYGWVDISQNIPGPVQFHDLSDVYFINDDEGWITSSSHNEIYHTTDGGQTFTVQTISKYTNAIWMLNADTGYAGGQGGIICRTVNGGNNWTYHGTITTTLTDIAFPPQPADTGYACGDNGRIGRITPSGVTLMNSGMVGNLSAICFPSTKEGWACGGNVINHFTVGTWNLDQSYTSGGYSGLYFIDNQIGWAAGDKIIHTTDGENWITQTNPDPFPGGRAMLDVFFLNANEGWIVGNQGLILRTLNGGLNWTVEADGLTASLLRGVQFTSPTKGYIAGNNRTLLKYTQITSTDGASQHNNLTLFPNPTTGKIRSNTTFRGKDSKWALYDIFGRLICETLNPSDNEMDISALPPTVYLLQIISGQKVHFQKIIKQ